MKKLLLVAVLFVTLLTNFVVAETFKLPSDEPTVSVTIPKAWKPEELEKGVSCESPDQVATILFEGTSAKGVDGLIDENVDWLLKEQNVKIDEATKSEKDFEVGERNWSRISWDATSKDFGPAIVGFLFTALPDDQLLTVTYWITKADNEKHWGTIEKMLTSVKPVKADESADE